MANMNLEQHIHIVPIRATTTDTATFVAPHVNMKLYEKVEFVVMFGTLSGGSNVLTVTQSAVTAGSASTAIAARYRMPAAAGTDSMGDVTALASTGLTLTYGTFNNKGIIVDVESQDLINASLPYVGLTFTGANSATSTIWALCWPKYPQATNASALT
jgi:hypothetical protein